MSGLSCRDFVKSKKFNFHVENLSDLIRLANSKCVNSSSHRVIDYGCVGEVIKYCV